MPIVFTIRPFVTLKGNRYAATVFAPGDFTYHTRNYRRPEGARNEALRAIRQLHVIRKMPDDNTRVVTAFGESTFDDTRAFRATPPKRIRRAT